MNITSPRDSPRSEHRKRSGRHGLVLTEQEVTEMDPMSLHSILALILLRISSRHGIDVMSYDPFK